VAVGRLSFGRLLLHLRYGFSNLKLGVVEIREKMLRHFGDFTFEGLLAALADLLVDLPV
jgi:hypothetical protein